MGNAADDIKKMATHVTASNENEGFAKAIEIVLNNNRPASMDDAGSRIGASRDLAIYIARRRPATMP